MQSMRNTLVYWSLRSHMGKQARFLTNLYENFENTQAAGTVIVRAEQLSDLKIKFDIFAAVILYMLAAVMLSADHEYARMLYGIIQMLGLVQHVFDCVLDTRLVRIKSGLVEGRTEFLRGSGMSDEEIKGEKQELKEFLDENCPSQVVFEGTKLEFVIHHAMLMMTEMNDFMSLPAE